MEYANPESRLRAEQLGRIGGFRAPTWAEHFAKVDALLDRLSEPVDHE